MPTMSKSSEGADASWNDAQITVSQSNQFALQVTTLRADQEIIARNLLLFPSQIRVRGIFFEGLSRLVAEQKGPGAMAELLTRAGVSNKTTAFRAYPHRDFYKLYYLTARLLHPTERMGEALRLVARTFFPIFKNSLVGRTMSALMGDRPTTLLPLLARAYNVSVEGNDHHTEVVGERSLAWRCEVEPVEWYTETFSGIVEGAMPPELAARIHVEERAPAATMARYRFRIDW
jgi:uncharacterized protein (TIGR02265 family)